MALVWSGETADRRGVRGPFLVCIGFFVTGLVVGIDPGNHTLQMVDPSGGAVTTAQVTSEAGLRNFDLIKVGDRITAVISAALAVALDPAT